MTRYLSRGIGGLGQVGELERTILVLRAAGLSPRRFAGRDLVARLERHRRRDGSFDGYVSYTAFGVLALRAAGAPPAASVGWLAGAQNADGGFGLVRRAASDADMTGAVLQALVAGGRRGSGTARRAARRLVRIQNRDGGFGSSSGEPSNAQSTAYAVQGLVAARSGGAAVRAALRYLKRLQRRDGSVRYSRGSAQTPVWVTAQALSALRRRPLPIATVRRAHRVRHRAAAASAPPARHARPRRHGPAAVSRPAGARAAIGPDRRDPPGLALGPAGARRVAASPPGGDGGVPPLLLAGAGVATALALLGARRALRRRRAVG